MKTATRSAACSCRVGRPSSFEGRRAPPLGRAGVTTTVALALALAGCETYDGPPNVSIEGLTDGLLSDPAAPLVVAFSEPIDPATLKLSVARYVVDIEGNLGDEDDDPATELDPILSYDPELQVGGQAELVDDDRALRIVPEAPLPIGPRFVVLVEPGLADRAGIATRTRKRLPFGYQFDLDCEQPSKLFRSGTYFLLADVDEPLELQVQLLVAVELSPDSGEARATFTNADRNPEPGRCPFPCDEGKEVCRLYPEPACVKPSEYAGTVDEHRDWVPNPTPPKGYSFAATACAQDQADGSVVFQNAPADVVVESPPVTLRNVRLNASLREDEARVLRGTGSFKADAVLLGTSDSGPGVGGIALRWIPPDEVPPGVPQPAPAEP